MNLAAVNAVNQRPAELRTAQGQLIQGLLHLVRRERGVLAQGQEPVADRLKEQDLPAHLLILRFLMSMSSTRSGCRTADRCRPGGRRLLPSRLAIRESQQPPPTFRPGAGWRPSVMARDEHLVKQLFVAMGAEAWTTIPSKDGGVDAVATSKHLFFGHKPAETASCIGQRPDRPPGTRPALTQRKRQGIAAVQGRICACSRSP
jgi:hypothetical protein